jgi:hypothetical protein
LLQSVLWVYPCSWMWRRASVWFWLAVSWRPDAEHMCILTDHLYVFFGKNCI